MGDAARYLLVGLTGGIASGKTTVARFLQHLGSFVVDADTLAHEVIAPGGSAHDAVVDRFGNRILDEHGRVDRATLGRRVFHDAEAREALNAIVHPAVRAEFQRRVQRHIPRGVAPIAVFDAALLVETGRFEEFHRLIVTRCGVDLQLARLIERNALSQEEAEARIAAQAPLERKLAVADYVIDTGGEMHETQRQTEQVHERLVADCDVEFGRSR